MFTKSQPENWCQFARLDGHRVLLRNPRISCKHNRPFWTYVAALYILLAPISIFLPPISIVGIDINMVRWFVLALFIYLLKIIPRIKSTPNIISSKNVSIAFALIYVCSIAMHSGNGIFVQLVGSYNLFSFWVFFLLLAHADEVNCPLSFWSKALILSCCLAFTICILLKIGLIGIPSYRIDVSSLFELSRTASVVDGTIGVWALLGVVYINSSRETIKYVSLFSVMGLLSSMGLILFAQFRVLFAVYCLIAVLWLYLPSLKTIRLVWFIVLILLPINLLINFENLSQLEIVDRFTRSFNTEGQTDVSWQLHTMERLLEVELIQNRPFTGYGWDVTERFFIGDSSTGFLKFYGHCLYTALPVRIGLPLALIYIGIFFVTFSKGMLIYHRSKRPDIAVCTIAVGTYLLLSFTQNLTFTSLTFFCLAIYINRLLGASRRID